MYFYLYDMKIFFSLEEKNRKDFKKITEIEAESLCHETILYFLTELDANMSRRSFSATSPDLLTLTKEDLHLLRKAHQVNLFLPEWIQEKIEKKQVCSINCAYPYWEKLFLAPALPDGKQHSKWRVHVVGLGDVGGTLITGLRLLGGKSISQIGIYDKDINKINRWQYEASQIFSDSGEEQFPEVLPIQEENLFQCDMFVFCVSIGVPEVGKEKEDVRLIQFKGNSSIVSYYAKLARKNNFHGIFAVVSDPVDLLCKVALQESNLNEEGKFDYLGLAPEQIRGYGLGVMHARAVFYAKQKEETIGYLEEGRAFGPHGEGLIIANSMNHYDDALSTLLTEKTKKANLDVRATGFKPYIAPALSSGALSLLATIESKWHYSATYIGGTFMGSRNRLLSSGIELESFDMPDALFCKLQKTHAYLSDFMEHRK